MCKNAFERPEKALIAGPADEGIDGAADEGVGVPILNVQWDDPEEANPDVELSSAVTREATTDPPQPMVQSSGTWLQSTRGVAFRSGQHVPKAKRSLRPFFFHARSANVLGRRLSLPQPDSVGTLTGRARICHLHVRDWLSRWPLPVQRLRHRLRKVRRTSPLWVLVIDRREKPIGPRSVRILNFLSTLRICTTTTMPEDILPETGRPRV